MNDHYYVSDEHTLSQHSLMADEVFASYSYQKAFSYAQQMRERKNQPLLTYLESATDVPELILVVSIYKKGIK